MPDWDANSPELAANLKRARALYVDTALERRRPTLAMVKSWHATIMDGLDVPDPSVRGNFRGKRDEPFLVRYEVGVLGVPGVSAAQVDDATRAFEGELQRRVASLDARIPKGEQPADEDELDEVIELAAWAHAEWVRIHPFANGNGRTARMWANHVLIRYRVPPFVSVRPRPGGGYGAASAAAMRGRIGPTIALFQELYDAWDPEGTE